MDFAGSVIHPFPSGLIESVEFIRVYCRLSAEVEKYMNPFEASEGNAVECRVDHIIKAAPAAGVGDASELCLET